MQTKKLLPSYASHFRRVRFIFEHFVEFYAVAVIVGFCYAVAAIFDAEIPTQNCHLAPIFMSVTCLSPYNKRLRVAPAIRGEKKKYAKIRMTLVGCSATFSAPVFFLGMFHMFDSNFILFLCCHCRVALYS